MNHNTLNNFVDKSTETLREVENLKSCIEKVSKNMEGHRNTQAIQIFSEILELTNGIIKNAKKIEESSIDYIRKNDILDFDLIEERASEIGKLYKEIELKRHDLFGALITPKLSITPQFRNDCIIQDGVMELIESIKNSDPSFDDYADELLTATRTMPGLTPDNYVIHGDGEGQKKSLIFYDWKVSVSQTSEIHTVEKYYKCIQTYLGKVNDGKFLEENPIYIIVCMLNPLNKFPILTTRCRVTGPFENSAYKTSSSRFRYAKTTNVTKINKLSDFYIDGLEDFYSSTQLLKDYMLHNFPELIDHCDKNYFQEWVRSWKGRDCMDTDESINIYKILEHIHDDVYTNEECCHMILGNFTDHLSTMTVNQVNDLMDSYTRNMKKLGYKPKKNPIKLKEYIDELELKKNEKYKKVYSELKENVVKDIKTRRIIADIDEAFEINAKEYEEKHPDCFKEDLAETKCNFSFTWSPHRKDIEVTEKLDYNNAIVSDFRNAFLKCKEIRLNRPYHTKVVTRQKVNKIFNMIKACLTDFSTNTTACKKSESTDVFNLNTGSIDVERTDEGKRWYEHDGILTRNKNEFNVNVPGKEDSKKMFYDGLREMKVNMSRGAKAKKRLITKDIISRTIKHSNEKEDNDKDNEGEEDMSQQIVEQEEIVKTVHKKKLIRHNNQAVESWMERIKYNLFELQLMDTRAKGKIRSVYDFYSDNPECLFMKSNCITEELNLCKGMHQMMSDISVYSFLEDQMQISKGLMTADRYMSATDFKFLCCSNSSMMAVAFKGDGINTGVAGVPFVMLHKVEESMSENFMTGYTKEIYGYFHSKGHVYFMMRPQRLNQIRLLSLFKSPSKMPPCFSLYLSRSEKIREKIKEGYKKASLFEPDIKKIVRDVWFASKSISSVTNLSGMIMFDFMRYAGFLPLADFSDVKGYIADKFDPEITNCVDFYLMAGIKRFLNKMIGMRLSDKARTIVIDQEMDISGGIKDLNVQCPITGIHLQKFEDLHNNISLGIYMLPKNMHNHTHNMKSLLSVSAEWELKMRDHFGYGINDEIKPERGMFDGTGKFSIDGVLSLLSLREYYKTHVVNVNVIRNNIETKENFLQPCYRTNTLNSSKKCSKPNFITLNDICYKIRKARAELDSITEKTNISDMLCSLRDISIIKGLMFAYRHDNSIIQNLDEDIIRFIKRIDTKDANHLWLYNPKKMTRTQHPLTVETFICLLTKSTRSTTLKSEKVSECLYELVKEYHNIVDTSFQSLMQMDPRDGTEGKKHTFIELLEYVMASVSQLEKYELYLVSVFEKHQRTKTDREIYLMGMKCKMMLYFIEHSFKHVAQSDPSEAISISGEYKIKTLSNLSLTAISSYHEILSRDINAKLSFVSADQSKWSASDMVYKYILAILMCPIFTSGERTLMIECLMMYIKYKRVVIPSDIFIEMVSAKKEYGEVNNFLYEVTEGLSRNWYPVTMNWLQGNLNYLSSVFHSCAMLAYKNVMKQETRVDYKIKWMVHSDDNATSMIMSGDVESVLEDFECGTLCEFHFMTMKHHFPKFSITLNPKKTYAAESQVEFISEKFVNGAVVPPYCRNLANCCTEASHQNYYDDLMSLSINITMLARKGCPNEVIPFAYAAVQVQALSLYSMMPGEENDIHKIIKDENMPLLHNPGEYNIPACIGGWMTVPIDQLSILSPSVNDEIIYYKTCSQLMGCKNFNDFQNKVRDGFIDKNPSLSRKLESENDDETRANIAKLNLFRLTTETQNSESLEFGTRFQSCSGQIINLPNYNNKNLMSNMPSFRDFCREFPNLKDNEELIGALKNSNDTYDYAEFSKEGRSREQMLKLYQEILERPELTLIAPLNDRDFIRSRIFQYSSVSKRNQICNQSTEKLAIDRILRSKAKTFLLDDFQKKVSYKEVVISHLKKCFSSRDNLCSILSILATIISNDVNFQMVIEITDKMIVTNSNPKQNYNFRWIIPERFTRIFEGSPGLIVIKEFYGATYLEKLGLNNIPLTENAVETVAGMFGSIETILDIKVALDGYSTGYQTEEFAKASVVKRSVLASNNMISCQNKLMTLNVCCNRKPYPVYSLYNMGRTSTSNYTSFLSTIYSQNSLVFFIALIDWNISVSTRTIRKQTEDVSLSRALDSGMYITDRLQGLFPSLRSSDLRDILKTINYFSDNLDDYILAKCNELARDISAIRTPHLLRAKHELMIRMLSRSIAWLFNMGYIGDSTFNFLYKYGSKADVVYIRAEEIDGEGNYNNNSTYCIGTKSDYYYTTLRYSSAEGFRNTLDIHVQSSKDMIVDERISMSAKNDINKLLTKFIRDKKEVIKLCSTSDVTAKPETAYIRISSRNELFPSIPDQVCNFSNVKMAVDIKYTKLTEEIWETFNNNDDIRPRKADDGEIMTNLYKYVTIPDQKNYKAAMRKVLETINFMDQISSIFTIVKDNSDFNDDDDSIMESLKETIFDKVEEFMESPDPDRIEDFISELEDELKSLASMFDENLKIAAIENFEYKKLYDESILNLNNAIDLISFLSKSEEQVLRTPRPIGRSITELINTKLCVVGGYDVLALLRLVKMAEVCHNNGASLSLSFFKSIRNKKYIPRSAVNIECDLVLNHSNMRTVSDYNTLSLGDIKLNESTKEFLRRKNFKVETKSLLMTDPLSLEIEEHLDLYDDKNVYSYICRNAKFKSKKDGHLIPSNTLLLSEVLKSIFITVNGDELDMEVMIKRLFTGETSKDQNSPRLFSLISFCNFSYIMSRVLHTKARAKESELMLNLSDSIYNMLKIMNINISQELIYDYDDSEIGETKEIMNKIFKKDDLKELNRLIDYSSLKVSIFNDDFMFLDVQNKTIDMLITSCKTILHKKKETIVSEDTTISRITKFLNLS